MLIYFCLILFKMIDDHLFEINEKPLQTLPTITEYTDPHTGQQIQNETESVDNTERINELKKEIEKEETKHNIIKEKYNEIKNKVDDNLYLSFCKSCFDKYKYLFLFIIVVIVIVFIESRVAQNFSDCSYWLDKRKILKIRPPCFQMDENDYIYVYNITMFERRGVLTMCEIPSTYKKKSVMEHMSVSISRPMKRIKEGLGGLFNGCTPISNLSNALAGCCNFSDRLNPLTSGNLLISDWCIVYPSYLNVKCFTTRDKIIFTS